MEQSNEEKELINFSNFLATKGQITKIKDPNKKYSIVLSDARIKFAIILGMISVGLFIWSTYCSYLKIFVNNDKYTNISMEIIIYIMWLMFSLSFLWAAIYNKREAIVNVKFLSDTVMMVNKLKIDIKENICYFDVFEEYCRSHGERRLEWRLSIVKDNYEKYYNMFVPQNHKKVIYEALDKAEEKYFQNFGRRTDVNGLRNFINNFEYTESIMEEKYKVREKALNFYKDYNNYFKKER